MPDTIPVAAPDVKDQAPIAAPVATPVLTMRRFGDVPALRRAIYDRTLEAARSLPPLVNARYTLSLHDPHYDGPEEHPLRKQKEVLLSGGTLSRRLRGTWRLTDNTTGRVADERLATVAHVPILTPRNTFILGGSEWVISSQSRLRPGVYTRRAANGEVESQVNVQGRGLGHRYFLDPASGVFKIRAGQAEVPLIPLMRALGASDRELKEAWGADVFQANLKHDADHQLQKLHDKFVRRPTHEVPGPMDQSTLRQRLAQAVRELRLDPDVTRRTLGRPYVQVDKDVALAITRRLLDINRGRAEPDDREHMAYQQVFGPEDLIAERIGKDRTALGKMLWQATFHGNLSKVPPGAFTKPILSLFQTSGLGAAPEGVSAAEFIDHGARLTRLGEGGMSAGAIPTEATQVHPSQLGFVDLTKSPESESAGVDMRVSFGVQKGSDGRLYAPFRDTYTGKIVYRSPQDVADLVVAFPGELASGRPYVAALDKGRAAYVPRQRAVLELPNMEQAFSPLSNMVPMKSAAKGQRVSMGARMASQALPLVSAEAPHVRTAVPGQPGKSFEELYGRHAGAVHADQGGHVEKVEPHGITVRHDDGSRKTYELYHDWPLSRKTGYHNDPLVQPRDRVEPGQLLAKGNFTDDKGHLAYGLNARVAFVPFHSVYDDSAVISESFARRMTSQHYYQHRHDWDDSHRRGKNAFVALFPGKYPRKTLETLGDDGVVKVGQTVGYGDPLVLVAAERERDFAQAGRSARINFADKSVTWDHHSPGVVTDVVHGRDGVNVVVKSTSQMQTGDKLSGRFGSKSVVNVVPDHQMPHDEQGRPFDMTWSPLQLLSRVNPSWVVEGALGKVAAKTGKPYAIEDWGRIPNLTAYAQQELEKHGLSDTETVVDPSTGRKIPNVLTGVNFIMKLHHQAEAKAAGRGLGSYDAAGAPQKGGEGGAKRLSIGDSQAILSAGASQVLREAHTLKGSQNPDFWLAYMTGFPPPHTKVPRQYEKFLADLTASGLKVRRDGHRLRLMALTDKDINERADGRELKNTETVRWDKGLEPVKGGLFDPSIAGGHGSQTWSKITLHEPMLNPAFEEPARRLLDLTGKAFREVLAGRTPLSGGGTGPEGIRKALADIRTSEAIEEARKAVASGKKGARDEAIRRLRYLKASESTGVHPKDWILHAVPVLPPAFRPVSLMAGSRGQLVADANLLYKEVFDANENLKALSGRVADVGDERLALYDAFKAVVGLGDPTHPKNVERGVKGILRNVLGSSAKYSVVQQKLLGTTVDLSGRAVITPDPDLDMDSVGLPEDKAWEVFTPFVVRRLVRRGVPRVEAMRATKDRERAARDALVEEMKERPVLVNRYPVLHRYNVMAFFPHLVSDDTIHVNPLVTKGYGADFDGDASQFHVVVSDEAIRDAKEKMLPSKNLLSAATFRAHQMPSAELLQGLHAASTAREDRRPLVFRSRKDVLTARKRGELSLGQPVEVLED